METRVRDVSIFLVCAAMVAAVWVSGVVWAGESSEGGIELFSGEETRESAESETGADASAGQIRINGETAGTESRGDAGVQAGEESGGDAGGTGVVITHGSAGESGVQIGGQPERPLTLPFSKRGSAMLVPVTVSGMEAYMVFDTGASYTTLTPAAAARAGVSPPQDAPTEVVATANGRTRVEFGIIDALTLDGRTHGDVTYGVCEACRFGGYKGKMIAGLLGLNITSRYEVTIDSTEGQIRLEPSEAFGDRHRDIEPWVSIDGIEGIWPSRGGEQDRTVDFTVRNRSGEYLEDLELAIRCLGKHVAGSERYVTTLSLGPNATKKTSARVPEGTCRRPRVKVVGGGW
jgi:hypothetical protein